MAKPPTVRMNFKLPLSLRRAFVKKCKAKMDTPSNVLRQFMLQYTTETTPIDGERYVP